VTRKERVLLELGLRLIVLGIGAGAVILGLLSYFRSEPQYVLECKLPDGTTLEAPFPREPRRWPQFGVKTLRVAQPFELVASFRLVSAAVDEPETVREYDLFLADGHPYLLRRTRKSPAVGEMGTEVTGEWFELLPLEPAVEQNSTDRPGLVSAAANQLAALSYAPEVRLLPSK